MRELFERLRWGDEPACPHCGSVGKIYRYKDGKLFKCPDCRKQFTVTVGTIFEKTHLPLRTWFMAIFYFLESKRGISSYQLARFLDIQQKTAWFLLQKIRFATAKDRLYEKLRGVIEVDETFIGGRNSNRHFRNRKPFSQGRSYNDKTPVFGILERGTGVRTFVIQATDARTLQGLIRKNVVEGSVVISDSWRAYMGLSTWYYHKIINHSLGSYVDGNFHTNSIEGFWSFMKRGLSGTYNHVSKKYLQRYCDEFSFRYNNRGNTVLENFHKFLNKAIEESITYNEVFSRSSS